MKLNLSLALLGMTALATAAQAQTITVWDFKSGDPVVRTYLDSVETAFEAAHPGVDIKHVPQPHDQYYNVLSTAISADSGPDIAILHGGTPTRSRSNAFIPLNEEVEDIVDKLAGWDAFSADDGTIVAVPLTLQGYAIYYNKELYKEAGLDPENPPQTWEELETVCAAILERTDADCFVVGNKSSTQIGTYVAGFAVGFWTEEDRRRFIAGEMDWTEPQLTRLIELWEHFAREGWFKKGANSLETYTDAVNEFMRGTAAHDFGLISDTANWRQFEDFMGPENVGVMLPVAIGVDPETQTDRLPAGGGIGYAVTRWTPHQELAAAYLHELVKPEHMKVFFETAGAIVSNKNVDVAATNSPGAKKILAWLDCCLEEQHPSAFMNAEEQGEMRRQGHLLISGDVTSEEAVASIQSVRETAQSQTNQ